MIYFSSGDAPFYFEEQMESLSWLPQVWESFKGFGVNLLPRLWIDYPFRFFIKLLSSFGLEWGIIEKLLWAGALLIGIVSMYRFSKYILGKQYAYVSILIYLTNTYALFLFGGGQLGVALAYAFSPWVLYRFIKGIDESFTPKEIFNFQFSIFKQSVINGLWLGLLIMFDLRLAYLVMGAVALYVVLKFIEHRITIKKVISHLSLIMYPIIVASLFHLFWILPMAILGGGVSGLGEDFTNPGMLRFLSFADFSHSISLLHPNWPENLFGKVYFLQPEFLILPILAFASLWIVSGFRVTGDASKNSNSQHATRNIVTFFPLLALLGAFLAKGANPPFGELYIWLFDHVPGFVMFRDPTKFYLFTAIAYSILIPFTLMRCIEWMRDKFIKLQVHQVASSSSVRLYKLYELYGLFTIFIVFWLFTLRPLFLGQLTGNFRPQTIPSDYVRLKDMLIADPTPSRTLWIPGIEKFAFASDTHPELSGTELFDNASISEVLTIATSSSFLATMNDAGVRFVVVPKDVEGNMFLTEYRSDPALRERVVQALGQTPFTALSQYEDIAVFENPSFTEMRSFVPDIVGRQQRIANLGLVVGGSVTLLLGVWIFTRSHKNE